MPALLQAVLCAHTVEVVIAIMRDRSIGFYTAHGPAGQVVQQRAPSVVTPSEIALIVTAAAAAAAVGNVSMTRSC